MMHTGKPNLCNKIRANGWGQGLFFLSCPHELGIGQSKKENLYLLVTHSCDIVHESFKDEPVAEAILAQPTNVPDGQLTYGKSPRKIHVEIQEKEEIRWCEFSTSNRVFFDRKKLATLQPSPTYKITQDTLANLIDWLSKKYDRAAFPDEFNQRVAKCKNRIKNLLKKNGHDILGLFIKLVPDGELSHDKPYHVSLSMLVDDDASDDDLKFSNVLEKIVEYLEENPGIRVLEGYNVATPEKMTLKDYISMQHWDFDYLSYRDKGSVAKNVSIHKMVAK